MVMAFHKWIDLNNYLATHQNTFIAKICTRNRKFISEKLITDSNTLIDISSNDKYMRHLANEINIQLRKLQAERRKFQKGDLELKNAVTNISHDLRTPLTAIYGYLDLLEQEEKSETVNRYIAVIRNRTKMLKQLMQFKYSGKSIPSSGVGILLSYKS